MNKRQRNRWRRKVKRDKIFSLPDGSKYRQHDDESRSCYYCAFKRKTEKDHFNCPDVLLRTCLRSPKANNIFYRPINYLI